MQGQARGVTACADPKACPYEVYPPKYPDKQSPCPVLGEAKASSTTQRIPRETLDKSEEDSIGLEIRSMSPGRKEIPGG